jgi:hypothetical protein
LLFLAELKSDKIVPFSIVRGWESCYEKAGTVFGGGGLTQAVAGIKMIIDARNRTGIFFRFRDIDCPVWHVRLTKEADIDKWHEILTQFILEGVIPDHEVKCPKCGAEWALEPTEMAQASFSCSDCGTVIPLEKT